MSRKILIDNILRLISSDFFYEIAFSIMSISDAFKSYNSYTNLSIIPSKSAVETLESAFFCAQIGSTRAKTKICKKIWRFQFF